MGRVRIEKKEKGGGVYFDDPRSVHTFTSGCALFDCVLGGGWALDRVLNVVGDKSTGKTLIAIEAAANFAARFGNGRVRYVETEAAFDLDYAETLGFPRTRVELVSDTIFTVEEWFQDLKKQISAAKKHKQPQLYILDSLDALSDRAEYETDIEEGTFGTSKAKMMSRLFRQLSKSLAGSHVTVMIISQIRDKIGVRFGDKTQRAGGRAMDFYASQVVKLAQVKEVQRTVDKIKRAVGILVAVKCTKNKIGPPFRRCQFPLIFGYGIEDMKAGLDWLIEVGRWDALGIHKSEAEALAKSVHKLDADTYEVERDELAAAVKEVWAGIEESFRPVRRKYES